MKVISGLVVISCALGAIGQQDYGYNYMQQESPPFTYEAGTPPNSGELVFRVLGESHGDQTTNHVEEQYNPQEEVPTFKVLGNDGNNLGGYQDNELRFRVLHEEERHHENHAFDRPLVQMNGGFDYEPQSQPQSQQQPLPQPQLMNVVKYMHDNEESDGYDYRPPQPQPQRPEKIIFRLVKKEHYDPRPVQSFSQHGALRVSEEVGFRGPRVLKTPKSFEHSQTKVLRVLRDDGPSPFGGESEVHQHTKVIRVIRQDSMSAGPGHQQTRVLRIIEENRPQAVSHHQESFRPEYSRSNFQRSAPVAPPQSRPNYQTYNSNRNNQQVNFLRAAPPMNGFETRPRFTRNNFSHIRQGGLKF